LLFENRFLQYGWVRFKRRKQRLLRKKAADVIDYVIVNPHAKLIATGEWNKSNICHKNST